MGVHGVIGRAAAPVGGFLPRHDEDLREPLVRRQGCVYPSTYACMLGYHLLKEIEKVFNTSTGKYGHIRVCRLMAKQTNPQIF